MQDEIRVYVLKSRRLGDKGFIYTTYLSNLRVETENDLRKIGETFWWDYLSKAYIGKGYSMSDICKMIEKHRESLAITTVEHDIEGTPTMHFAFTITEHNHYTGLFLPYLPKEIYGKEEIPLYDQWDRNYESPNPIMPDDLGKGSAYKIDIHEEASKRNSSKLQKIADELLLELSEMEDEIAIPKMKKGSKSKKTHNIPKT